MVTLATIGAGMVAALVAADPLLARWRPSSQDGTELLALAAWQAAVIALTLAVAALPGGRRRDVLALGPARGSPLVFLNAALLLLVLNALVSVVQYLLIPDDMLTDLRPFARMMTGSDWQLAFVAVGIGAPLSEELLFRGFLLAALARTRLTFAGAALITTFLWAAMHAGYSAVGIAEVFTVGLFFSWLLWRTGSLWVAIFCHALYNSLIVVVLRYVPLPA